MLRCFSGIKKRIRSNRCVFEDICFYRITSFERKMEEQEVGNLTLSPNMSSVMEEEEGSHSVDHIIVPIVYGIIFIIGLIGNGLLIYTVLANKSMRTIPNIFLTSLAIGDFFLILVSVPSRAILYIFDQWWFGEAMCKITEFMITLSLGTSTFTLTALTGDRFVAIVLPMSALGWSTMRKTVQISVLLWILSLILAAPDLITSTVVAHVYDNTTFQYCEIYGETPKNGTWDSYWEDGEKKSYWYYKFRPMFQFVVFFAIPLFVIATMYISIARVLLRKSSIPVRDAVHVGGATSWKKQMKGRQKVAKTVLTIVVLFAIFWAPRYIYIFIHRFTPDFEFNMYYHILKITGIGLSFAYSCVNPVALYMVSDEFGRYFNHYLFGCCCPSRRLRATAPRKSSVGLLTVISHVNGSSHQTTPRISMEDITHP